MDLTSTTAFIYIWLSFLITSIGVGFAAYYVLSAPFRRIDCANLVVELNELAVATGRNPEDLFKQLGGRGVRGVPHARKFSRLSDLMKSGRSFIESLRVFHSLLPGEIFGAMELARNERDSQLLAKLSRAHLEDGGSRAQNSFKLFLSSLLIIPTTLYFALVSMIALTFVIPKFKDTFADMLGKDGFPEITEFILSLYDTMRLTGLAMVIPALLIMFVAFLPVAHLYGLSASHDTGSILNRLFSRLAWLMPWRRNRIKRNFIWIFCELLDNGVLEVEAIETAAAATKNSVVRGRAAKAVNDLRNGQPLAKALRRFDRRADLAWRVENAGHGSATFRETLEGWTNHLSALAYKQQQSAFYYAFTLLTLFNGLCVLCFALIIFMPLAAVMENMT
jgi:type II secretory pathway component PulF